MILLLLKIENYPLLFGVTIISTTIKKNTTKNAPDESMKSAI